MYGIRNGRDCIFLLFHINSFRLRFKKMLSQVQMHLVRIMVVLWRTRYAFKIISIYL